MLSTLKRRQKGPLSVLLFGKPDKGPFLLNHLLGKLIKPEITGVITTCGFIVLDHPVITNQLFLVLG
jgi:hypothetical protein